MVFGGLLNKRLSGSITAAGQPAIGISAADAACFSAAPLVHNDQEGSLGFVGYLTGVKTSVLESLWREKLLPVAPCLGQAADGELYNINADHMAAACAEFINADHLIYLTDVAGVLHGESVISAISCEEVESLVQARVVSGGMVLKLEAAKRALEGGVSEVHIVGGNSASAVLDPHLFTVTTNKNSIPSLPGTRVLRSFGLASEAFV
jgi:acetylglutamate kinase